ncbi:hypothetical protein ACTWP6_02085 [Mycobacterium sp. 4D054]|uniref:hypothetical protein n=1 Tax=Mycobacterium sp. 4D054 TaxID=3457440 RepID=UPI003FD43C74
MARASVIRPVRVAVCALAAAPAIAGAPAAHAWDDNSPALNGTFTAFSDGKWAKTNEIMAYQADVIATWTITSSCTTFQDCTGTVVSDQGWTAELIYQSQRWRTTHTVEGWEKCPDGTTAPGEQSFTFWADRLDAPDRHDKLSGFDQTIGPTGACGVNRSLNIRMPLTLTRIA